VASVHETDTSEISNQQKPVTTILEGRNTKLKLKTKDKFKKV
jgi:hypothetical protein